MSDLTSTPEQHLAFAENALEDGFASCALYALPEAQTALEGSNDERLQMRLNQLEDALNRWSEEHN